MERSSDDSIQYRGAFLGEPPEQAVAVIEPLPSNSGAHWANRDSDPLFGRTAPYRRPPAQHSFPDHPVSPAPAGYDLSGLPSDGATSSDGSKSAAAELDAVGTTARWLTVGARRPPIDDRQPARTSGSRGRPAPSVIPPAPARRFGMAALKQRLAATSASTADRDDTIGMLAGPGHEIRPHRAVGRQRGGKDNTAAGTAVKAASLPRMLLWVTLSTVFVVLIGGIAAVVVLSGRSGGLALALSSATGPSPERTIAAALDGRTEASFELVTGTSEVTVRSADLGGDLYRITTGADSGTAPRAVVEENRVQLHLTPIGGGATGAVEIVLASSVEWALRFTGGAEEQRVDLRQGKVTGLDVVGGARRIELTLPTPTGTVPVRITGAVDEFVLTTPKDNPVRVRLDSGAKTVAAGDKTQRDVPPGSTFTPGNWEVADRYDVQAASRITLFSVEPQV